MLMAEIGCDFFPKTEWSRHPEIFSVTLTLEGPEGTQMAAILEVFRPSFVHEKNKFKQSTTALP